MLSVRRPNTPVSTSGSVAIPVSFPHGTTHTARRTPPDGTLPDATGSGSCSCSAARCDGLSAFANGIKLVGALEVLGPAPLALQRLCEHGQSLQIKLCQSTFLGVIELDSEELTG